MQEENSYILDTDRKELYRLGLQHQVWAAEAHRGWNTAKFTAGNTILDLGCGPGFCSRELAFVTGTSGKVIAIDRSRNFIDHLDSVAKIQGLNIKTIHSDFEKLTLEKESIDGMFCRWVLAWVAKPDEILEKVYKALNPGGKIVIQEYYDWSTHQTEPGMPNLSKGIAAALKSFKDSDSEIDIGREIPGILANLGMKITSTRLISKIARPDEFTWQWPRSFYESYFPRLVELGYLSNDDVNKAMKDLIELEKNKNSTLMCPVLIEVIAEK